jgi:hypothetical protein
MVRTIEAVIDEQGALLMIHEDQPEAGTSEGALFSEGSLAEDWNRPEEDEAWSHLAPAQ